MKLRPLTLKIVSQMASIKSQFVRATRDLGAYMLEVYSTNIYYARHRLGSRGGKHSPIFLSEVQSQVGERDKI